MGLLGDLRDARRKASERDNYPLSLDQWASYFSYNGFQYPLSLQQTLKGNSEEITRDFAGLVDGAFRSDSVVFACENMRLRVFSEARFQFRRMVKGRPGELFGTPELDILDNPWPGATTGDMLAKALLDADFAGNCFLARQGNRIRRLRPDWVTIVIGSQSDASVQAGDIDAEAIGYVYHPGGYTSGRPSVPLLAEQVCHFAPVPDPLASFRGMSWLTPVILEVTSDKAATTHKRMFFENGATPNMVVKLDANIQPDAFQSWVKLFEEKHEGALNAYRTLFLGGGADATVVGANMREISFKETQGAGETRIAAAAGVPPVIVGLSEGLQAATYSNYGQARRSFADTTMRSLWRNFAGSVERIINVPGGAHLWYDDRDIAFLRDDAKDLADIQQVNALAVRSLVDSGFVADSVIAAITANDLSLLVHSGLFSVQLQAPGSLKMPAGEVPGELPVGGTGKGPETLPVNEPSVKPISGNGKPPVKVGTP